MLVGQDDKIEIFKRLFASDHLAHGYIFFGEPQVGKATFAKSLANFLESGDFALPTSIQRETMLIVPTEGSLGIDAVQGAKNFLLQKPSGSSRRTVIIDDAYRLTPQAQNAVLKIAEEPPASGLIILVTAGLDALYKTLQSRLQKVYFPRIPDEAIKTLLREEYKLPVIKAATIASLALGRPGRAVAMATDPDFQRVEKLSKDFIEKRGERRRILDEVIVENDLLNPFVSHIMATLAIDPIANYRVLASLTERFSFMADFNTNKRLQMETALWNI